ncbi:hypothetical protein [Flagellimonas myxillae]|uniref:hypothetical protein n=1 Tax=Flagellimonas myxillae TaxID=2942214 RepID=UPI00201E8143|nr:hypothetical protein [Muricauda myxillae]MCL6265807.1 hypothetical protein [Muricauda myxillae]
MDGFNVQIAEFEYPFPSKLFEQELTSEGIRFKQFPRTAVEAGVQWHVFFIQNSDYKRAFEIKEKIDKQNVQTELKHLHPIRKILAYISLTLILVYVIYKAIGLINDLNF